MLKRASLQPDTLQKATDKTLLTNLIYYLAREEKQKVSIAKLRIALEMRETDQPLKQECIEEEKRLNEAIKSSYYQGTIPVPVRHLLNWLDENKFEIPALFNVVGLADVKTVIFETNLKNNGYVAENA